MPPKPKKRKTEPTVKTAATSSNNSGAVDTELYEVEKILDNDLEGNTIFYHMKWLGYSDDWNTKEAEWRMQCEEKLIDFAKSRISTDTQQNRIDEVMKKLDKICRREDGIKKIIDPLSIFGLTTVQCGSVRFVNIDSRWTKIKYMEYLRDSRQHDILHAAFVPTEDEIDEGCKRYLKELTSRLHAFPEYPTITIHFPLEEGTVFYPPPSLSNLLFEPVTQEMADNRNNLDHLFVAPSADKGFNKVTPFVNSSYLKRRIHEDPRYFDLFEHNRREKLYNGMNRIDYTRDPRFGTRLEMIQESGSGWSLRAAHSVAEGTPLLMMSGVICDWKIAHETLVNCGERIAFSSFIEIPKTEKCLDRRRFHDFSKFIPHSCQPTCSVRMVNSGNETPDLVVYTIKPLTEENNFEISLDYYCKFYKNVKTYFKKNRPTYGTIFELYEKRTDFVHCQCDEDDCREVLYIDRTTKKSEKKEESLQKLDRSFQFKGMRIAEPNRVWEIRSGQFVFGE